MNVMYPGINRMKDYRDRAINYLASFLPEGNMPPPPGMTNAMLTEPATYQGMGRNAMNILIPQPEDTMFGFAKPLLYASNPYSYGQLKNIPDEILQAIKNTEGAILNPEGNLTLNISRFQKPEQFGDYSIRNGVFYLPEHKSPYQKYYSTGKYGYGGGEKYQGLTTIENPLIAKAGTGGIAPIDAYDYLVGKNSYENMRRDILNKVIGYGKKPNEQTIADLLNKYGGNEDLAYYILSRAKGGNQLPYAIQENIVANTVKNAGYDSILGISKANKLPRLSELYDVRPSYYPDYGENILEYPEFYKSYR